MVSANIIDGTCMTRQNKVEVTEDEEIRVIIFIEKDGDEPSRWVNHGSHANWFKGTATLALRELTVKIKVNFGFIFTCIQPWSSSHHFLSALGNVQKRLGLVRANSCRSTSSTIARIATLCSSAGILLPGIRTAARWCWPDLPKRKAKRIFQLPRAYIQDEELHLQAETMM